jgi:hypothetical protein
MTTNPNLLFIKRDQLLTAGYKTYTNVIKMPSFETTQYGYSHSTYVTDLFTKIMPCISDIFIYTNSFAGNPEFPGEQTRVLAMAQWIQYADEYMDEYWKDCVHHNRLADYTMLNPQFTIEEITPHIDRIITSIRRYRSMVENIIASQSQIQYKRTSLSYLVETNEELAIHSKLQTIPEAITDIVYSFISDEILFRARFPAIDELDKSLSNIHVVYLRKLRNHIFARYREFNNNGLICITQICGICMLGIHHLFLSEYDNNVQANSKQSCIERVKSIIQLYEYMYNIFSHKIQTSTQTLSTEQRINIKCVLLKIHKKISNECIYIFKMIRFVGNIGKTLRGRKVSNQMMHTQPSETL